MPRAESGRQWFLYVDESGDFDVPQANVVVTGVLLRADTPRTRLDMLRKGLSDLVPGMPWPLHTTVAKRPSAAAVALAAWRLRRIERGLRSRTRGGFPDTALHPDAQSEDRNAARFLETIAHDPKALVDAPEHHLECLGSQAGLSGPEEVSAALDLLIAREPGRTARVLRALYNGKQPLYDDLRALDRTLEEANLATPVSSRVWPRVCAAIARLMRWLAVPDGSGLPAVLVFFSSDSKPGDFHPPGDGTDRYLCLLEALLARVAESLARLPGAHEVFPKVALRHVEDPFVGRPVPLHATRHLGPMCHRASTCAGNRVRLIPYEVSRFGDTVDTGYVLADFAANAVFRRVGDRALAALEAAICQALRVMPRSGSPERTHCQASGSAWSLRLALEQGRATGATHMRRWAREQALEWAGVEEGP